ncbi:hypothetical protein SAMN04488568_102153 [Maricaulis salignorans]|uniref:Uncharacterized protein n=1 Tax=Maricaulis salignorans TaxID=144026 RepID=A0A1G9MYT8_9PROT|nr:hypothetical protein SAMN04488568_102153 [Maricaulis salignorans]
MVGVFFPVPITIPVMVTVMVPAKAVGSGVAFGGLKIIVEQGKVLLVNLLCGFADRFLDGGDEVADVKHLTTHLSIQP